MPLAKCPRSGKLFNSDNGPVHPDYLDDEMADYGKVLEYIAEKPGSPPDHICNATGVTVDCIKRMIKQGRIEEVDFEALEKQGVDRAAKEESIAKRRQKILKELLTIKLPEKKEVSFGGTVRSALEEKLNM